MLEATKNNIAMTNFTDYPIWMPGSLEGIVVPNAFSKGFVLSAAAWDVSEHGAFVLTTGYTKLSQRVNTNDTAYLAVAADVSSIVNKTIICPNGSFDPGTSTSSTTQASSLSVSAKSVRTMSTGAALNASGVGINVASFHGLGSGIEFQRRSAQNVSMMQAQGISEVTAAGIVDAVDVWSFAAQPWSVCYDNSRVGGGAVVVIDKPKVGQHSVNFNPGAYVNEDDQTCVDGNGEALGCVAGDYSRERTAARQRRNASRS